jgi:hypothetical protein
LPGDIATADAAPHVVIDVVHHRDELRLLKLLGAVAAPTPAGAADSEPAMRAFRRSAVGAFLASVSPARPDESLISIDCGSVAGPLTPLGLLEGEPKARYTRALLEAQASFSPCEVRHTSSRYDPMTVEHPVIDCIRRYGSARTTSGLLHANAWIGPGLRDWAKVLPVADIPRAAADALDLPETLADLTGEQWEGAYASVVASMDVDLAAP